MYVPDRSMHGDDEHLGNLHEMYHRISGGHGFNSGRVELGVHSTSV